MPEAAFIVQLDDYQGFIVKKRHPSTLTLTEKTLNLVHYEHQKDEKKDIAELETEGMRIASFKMGAYPGWTVGFVLGSDELLEEVKDEISGMGRFMLELMSQDPDSVDLGEILSSRSSMPTLAGEQRCAQIYLTPSTALLLERLHTEGVESTAKLSLWLKSQVQTDSVDLVEAITPLMNSGLVKVELVGKTLETAFLLKDVFAHRAPPGEAYSKASETVPGIVEQYTEYVSSFFTPEPPAGGYNPTLPIDDPNSPILEDREKISRILSNTIQYEVLKSLRKKPLSLKEISEDTSFPEGVVQNALWAMEAERIAAHFEKEDVWALVTDPRMDVFFPEYVLPILTRKLEEKKINPDTARRYLELLIQTWSE
ncbi:MAG: hypothetical protein ACFFD9_03150 [Candidatus Thorarchaeota archaeon]